MGLAISQASIMTGMVQHGFRLFVEVMTQLTSVERIIEYLDLPKEHPLQSPTPLPENWPKRGRMVLKHVSMRYEENQPDVLKVSCTRHVPRGVSVLGIVFLCDFHFEPDTLRHLNSSTRARLCLGCIAKPTPDRSRHYQWIYHSCTSHTKFQPYKSAQHIVCFIFCFVSFESQKYAANAGMRNDSHFFRSNLKLYPTK